MKRAAMVLGLGLGVAVGACATDEDTATVTSDVAATKRFLVVFRSDTLPSNAGTKIKAAGGTVVKTLPNLGIALAKGTETFATKLAADSSVLAVGAEHYFRANWEKNPQEATPPSTNIDWFVDLQWDMRRIGAPALWNRSIPSSRVAVIDTGVMSDHWDLTGVVTRGVTTSFCAGDEPGQLAGYPSYAAAADLTIMDCSPIPSKYRFVPEGFHGTHVAGTIAAPVNGIGTVGVSPTTKITAYKVFDLIYDGYGYGFGAFDYPIFAAIADAVANGEKVINMSLGGQLDRSNRDENAAYVAWSRVTSWAYRNGTLIVAAAGNSNTNNNGTVAFIPSDLPSVMSVSATGTNQWVGTPTIGDGGFSNFTAAPGSDVLTFYSNYGAAVDIAAPGGDCGPTNDCGDFQNVPHLILSTCGFDPGVEVSPGVWDASGTLEPVWCWAGGTSMAAPHVAAVAAAVRALHPAFTAGDTRSWLKSTAIPMDSRQGFGAGIVDADAATR